MNNKLYQIECHVSKYWWNLNLDVRRGLIVTIDGEDMDYGNK